MTAQLKAVALLLFGSGLCALVYQIAWLRLLRQIFGASTAANAAVLAIFMGGLGLGGWLLGRRVDDKRSPLAFYAWLEVGVSLAAALSPLLILAVRDVYVGLGGTARLGPVAGTSLRLVLSAMVLGIPTFLMGGTLPAAARAVARAADRSRRSVALLYGANTLGAVIGALVTTFLALEHLGIRRSIWVAAALNVLIALAARALAARVPDVRPAEITPASESRKAGPPKLVFALFAAAAVGFVFLLMELVWYRMLAPILGGSSYTFGLILALALAGIGAGGLLYGAGSERRRPTLRAFAVTCTLEAVFLILPFALGDRLAVLALLLRPLGDLGFGMLALSWSLVTAAVVLPAAVVSGYQFPLLVAILGEGRRRVGRQVGLVAACNTGGAILGSIAGGFGLIPWLTAPGAWRGAALLLIALAGSSVLVRDRTRGRRSLRTAAVPLAIGVLGLVLCAAPGPTAFWRHTPIGAGRLPSSFDGPNALRKEMQERRRSILWEEDGVESSVALAGQAQYIFLLNGKADGSALRDAPNMVMSVLIGAALHPRPQSAMVIGLGSGLSAGWLAEVPSIERVDVVELEPAVARVAGLCAAVNHDVLSHPKVELRIGDGREFLLTSNAKYDLIFSQPSNPYRAGVASLFSREFYQAVAERLSEGGLLLQWLQGYEVDADLVAMAYATLGTVFPVVEIWQVHDNDLLLVAGREPWLHRLDQIRRRVAEEPWRSALDHGWGVEGVEGFYSGYLASPELATALARGHGGRINTDDHPRMEFGFARNLGREGLFAIADLRQLAASQGWDRPSGVDGEIDWRLAEELRTVASVTWGSRPRSSAVSGDGLGHRVRARQLYRQGDLRQALREWSSQGEPPRSPLDRLLLAEALAETGGERVPELAGELRRHRPAAAEAVLGRWRLRRGEERQAADHLIAVFTASRRDPWIYPPVLARSLQLAEDLATRQPASAERLFAALAEPFAVRLVDELRLRVRTKIAARLGDAARCVEAFEPFEPHVPWEGKFLLERFRCFERAGHPLVETAKRDVRTFLDRSPPRLEDGLLQEPES
ncbi:MAG: fused MFS/spermidine synthase [Thermoanaerobaculia bacterium]